VPIAGSLTFHQLGLIIAAACSLFAILTSFYLIFMHATHYTKPYEQRQYVLYLQVEGFLLIYSSIIRILFMIPVYATASFLGFWFYWHYIYFSVISDCYEAFAIASFFALLCHYIAPDLHNQKNYFRSIQPKPWVLPISWFKRCCGGDRGCARTPRSGLTWFNIIWTGIYQYCFIRVAMTVTAVLTQYFDKYCESSNSPVFAHIWVSKSLSCGDVLLIRSDPGHRRFSSLCCYVLRDPVLRPTPLRSRSPSTILEGRSYQTCHLPVLLAILPD